MTNRFFRPDRMLAMQDYLEKDGHHLPTLAVTMKSGSQFEICTLTVEDDGLISGVLHRRDDGDAFGGGSISFDPDEIESICMDQSAIIPSMKGDNDSDVGPEGGDLPLQDAA